jgi:hypothetical protein
MFIPATSEHTIWRLSCGSARDVLFLGISLKNKMLDDIFLGSTAPLSKGMMDLPDCTAMAFSMKGNPSHIRRICNAPSFHMRTAERSQGMCCFSFQALDTRNVEFP